MKWARLAIRVSIAVCGALAGVAKANDTDAKNIQDFGDYTPVVDAARISTDEAPVIDGDLSDAAWAKATIIEDFYQVEPGEGVPPSQPTRAYLMYDNDTLYFAIYAYDSEPHLIQRSQLRRDPALQDDDAVRIFIDSFGTFRDSFFFGVNPNGARSDALTENAAKFRDEWNTIWRAKTRIVDDGWIAEFAIPFQSISFDASLDAWNLQIIRTIRRNNEEIRWANIVRSRSRIDMTSPGRLTGIRDISSGIGLEAQLFARGAYRHDWQTDQSDFVFDPSANIFYKITPSLTGSLTFNTDFSDAPLDARQVNTGRFSLFFPETRNFFLQDAAVFEFGGTVYDRKVNGSPLFTRRIGIVDGAPVDILAGAKVSGKHGPFNIGAIATRTGSNDALGIDGQTLSALRVSTDVLSESKLGLIVTHGDPDGLSTNTVAGTDFRYRNSSFASGGVLLADFVYLRSFTDGVADHTFSAVTDYTGDKWGYRLFARQVGENYDPQMGFANRTGIREYLGFARRRFRPETGIIRLYQFNGRVDIVTDLDDRVEDRIFGLEFVLETNPGDELTLIYENTMFDIRAPFDIAGRVPVGVGKYNFNQVNFSGSTSKARRVYAGAGIVHGGIYDGDFLKLTGEVGFRPSPHFSVNAEYEYTEFDLPSGDVGIHVASVDSTIAFTADMSISTQIQYDNISENFSFFSRFAWEPIPEREIFLSIGHNGVIERERFPQSFSSQNSEIALRLGHTIRM